MDGFHSGWFFENEDGITVAVKVDEVLCKEKTKHNEITVFKSAKFGNVLVLDGVIQCTDRDEFAYHEMMAHLPLFSHPNPKKVLIVGGGDGGVLREVNKHTNVDEIHVCINDERVVELAKQYLPKLSDGYKSSKVSVHVEDDVEHFLEGKSQSYDVIIVDSIGGHNNEILKKSFYEKLNKALTKDGIVCAFAGCVWTDMPHIKNLKDTFHLIFPTVCYAFGLVVSCFVGGQVGFLLGSKTKEIVFENPAQSVKEEDVKEMKLQFYNRETHKACFVLPQFVQEELKK